MRSSLIAGTGVSNLHESECSIWNLYSGFLKLYVLSIYSNMYMATINYCGYSKKRMRYMVNPQPSDS